MERLQNGKIWGSLLKRLNSSNLVVQGLKTELKEVSGIIKGWDCCIIA